MVVALFLTANCNLAVMPVIDSAAFAVAKKRLFLVPHVPACWKGYFIIFHRAVCLDALRVTLLLMPLLRPPWVCLLEPGSERPEG